MEIDEVYDRRSQSLRTSTYVYEFSPSRERNALPGPRILAQGSYRLMVNGVKPNRMASIFNLIKTMSPEIQVYEKSSYGDVVVLNVFAPKRTPDQFIDFLRASTEPQLNVRVVDKRRFIVDLM